MRLTFAFQSSKNIQLHKIENLITFLQNEIILQMYKIFVNCLRLLEPPIRSNMKKALILFTTVLLLSCSNNGVNNDCFPFISVNETVNLNLPQFLDLQVPGGWAYTNGGHQGIIIYNINGTQFKAYDRLCPGENLSSCSQMIVDSNLRMMCPCDQSEFNILNGSPLTDGNSCFAKEYLVENLNGTVLRITNF